MGTDWLADLRRVHLPDFLSKMLADGLDPSTARNTLMPLRAVVRRALQRDEPHINPRALGYRVLCGPASWRAHGLEVVRSRDEQAGPILPKSKSSVRTIPVPTILNGNVTRHELWSGRRDGLMSGVSEDSPFTASNVRRVANNAWRRRCPRR